MNVARNLRVVTVATLATSVAVVAVAASSIPSAALFAQPATPAAVARLVAEPARLTMKAGQTAPLKVIAYDKAGKVIADAAVRVGGARTEVAYSNGMATAFKAGSFNLTASAAGAPGEPNVSLTIPVLVTWPDLKSIAIASEPGKLYVGTALAHKATGLHTDGTTRGAMTPTWTSSDASIASVDRFGNVIALKPGTVTITASAENVKATQAYTLTASPVASIELGIKESSINTGDVVRLVATAKNAAGQPVPDAVINWSYKYTAPADSTNGAAGPAIIDNDRFSANQPGLFTIMAQSGNTLARTTLEAKYRDVRRKITVTGRGNITSTHTSDLWPWTGKDGRDYCLVGTWGGDGYGMVFDITDMNNIVKTDSIKIDARTINDVTVSPDGRYGVLAREGASNRINGVVILDLANPAHPKIASTFDQELTGGVHNMFATNDHLFAISGGQKYVIIDVKDIYQPKYVSEYQHPNARIHDLWVRDGIAYSAQGGVGAVAVDVGNGKYGGTIEKPVLIATYPSVSGHEIYPYYQKSTGKMYLFLGDEEMNRAGRVLEGTNYSLSGPDGKPPKGGVPQSSGGYTRIVDFTDPKNPRTVGRYQLEDYGSHDIIVEDDVMYQAYYDGGVRVVDVSGELLGNLADQKREIAVFKPFDPQGFTPNAPFVMNAMPWKGQVLFTDFNSGLWAAKLEPKAKITP